MVEAVRDRRWLRAPGRPPRTPASVRGAWSPRAAKSTRPVDQQQVVVIEQPREIGGEVGRSMPTTAPASRAPPGRWRGPAGSRPVARASAAQTRTSTARVREERALDVLGDDPAERTIRGDDRRHDPGIDVGEQFGQRDLVREDRWHRLRPHPAAVGVEGQQDAPGPRPGLLRHAAATVEAAGPAHWHVTHAVKSAARSGGGRSRVAFVSVIARRYRRRGRFTPRQWPPPGPSPVAHLPRCCRRHAPRGPPRRARWPRR